MGVLRGIARAILTVVTTIVFLQVIVRAARKVYPFPIPPAVGLFVLESPLRRLFASAEETVRRIGLEPGQRALEIGAGTGFIALEAARAVGPEGQVVALDVEPRMLERLRQRTLVEEVANVEAKLGDAAKLEFPDETFDCVYMVTALGEMPDKRGVLWEAYRVLKPGGTLSVSEIILDADYSLKNTVIRLGEDAGFFLSEEHGNLLAYTVNFRKPSRRPGPPA